MNPDVRRQLAAASGGSGLEAAFARQLRACGITPTPEREYEFAPGRKWRLDFAWPDVKLGVELDGGTYTRGRHTRPVGYQQDCEKLNTAILLGWRVLRFTASMVDTGEAILMAERVLEALADASAR